MKKRVVQVSLLALIVLVLLASIPLICAGTEDKYYVPMDSIDAKRGYSDSLKNVKEFSSATFTIKPDEFNDAVSKNKIIVLELMGKEVELSLYETHVMGENTKVISTDEKGNMILTDAPNIRTYHGKVVGDEKSQAAITVCDNLLAGMIDVDGNAYYIDITKHEANGKNIHIIYRDEALEFDLTDGLLDDTDENEKSELRSFTTNADISLKSRSVTEIKILPCYDRDFKDEYGSYTAAETKISDMINTANTALDDHDAELTFDYYKKFSYLDSGTSQEIFDDFVDDIPVYRDFTDSDLTTLFYGQDFEGNGLGRGSNYNGSSERAYSVLQMVASTGSYGGTYPEQTIVLTHEIGHNLDAEHDEHYQWPGAYNFYTVMSPSVYYNSTHRVQKIFSDGATYGDATHNNGAHIEACKATVAAFRTEI